MSTTEQTDQLAAYDPNEGGTTAQDISLTPEEFRFLKSQLAEYRGHEIQLAAREQPKPALAVSATPGPTLEKFIDESTPTNEYSLHWEAFVGQEDACQIHVELTESEYQDLLRHLGESRGYAAAVVKAA